MAENYVTREEMQKFVTREEIQKFESDLLTEIKELTKSVNNMNLKLQSLEDNSGHRKNDCMITFDSRYIRNVDFVNYFNLHYENAKKKEKEAALRNVTIIEKLGNILSKWIVPIAVLLMLVQQLQGAIIC